MDKNFMRKMGFEAELKLIEEGKCPFCTEMVKDSDFRDDLSRKEFKLSGLCQFCQDATFGQIKG
jgi:hypothetical protein